MNSLCAGIKNDSFGQFTMRSTLPRDTKRISESINKLPKNSLPDFVLIFPVVTATNRIGSNTARLAPSHTHLTFVKANSDLTASD